MAGVADALVDAPVRRFIVAAVRYAVQRFAIGRDGARSEVGRSFYLSPLELETYQSESFASIWTRPELTDPENAVPLTDLEITDPWGHVLAALSKPGREDKGAGQAEP